MVDVQGIDALGANGLVQQRQRNHRVNAAADKQEHVLLPDFPSKLLHLLRGKPLHVPALLALADLEQEVLQHPPALRGMRYLDVELHAEHPALEVRDGRVRAVRRRADDFEAGGQPCDRVTMAHPHGFVVREAGKEALFLFDHERGLAVLFHRAGNHLAAQLVAHHLVPVADAEDGFPGLEQFGVIGRALGVVDASRPPTEDDSLGFAELGQGRERVLDLRVNPQAADAVGNEVGILSAEIENED